MSNFASPVLWPHPQWMMSCDELDFGRVRPGQSCEKEVLVSNVGAGSQALHCNLSCKAGWLQLRRGEAAEWESSLEVRLQAGEELLLLARANPELAGEAWGGQVSEVRIEALHAGIANAPGSVPNAVGRTELMPLRAKAYFLEPRFLTLKLEEVRDPSGTTTVSAGEQKVVQVQSAAVPLGVNPQIEFCIGRSDGLPSRTSLENCSVTQGKQQWVDCSISNRGDEQFLKLTFFTANRQPLHTHVLEIELRDMDNLAEPVRIHWHLTLTAPPLLGFKPAKLVAVAARASQGEIELSNDGGGTLRIDWVRVPGEFSGWLGLGKNTVWPIELAAGESTSVALSVMGKGMAPGSTVQGHIEAFCNHMGRQVARRVPVSVAVALHGVRIELNEADLVVVLDHGRSFEIPLRVYNDGSDQAWIRLAVVDQSNDSTWLSCESQRLNLPGGSQTATSMTVSSQGVPQPQKTAAHYKGVVMVVLLSQQQGESQIWSRPITLQVQPKPKRFGLF